MSARWGSLGAILALAAIATPQSTTYGRLTGTVRDAQGLTLPGVSVTLSSEAIMGGRTIGTEKDGRYLFQALPPARYNLRFEMPGFRTFVREAILVTTGTTIRIDANLELARFEEAVRVVGNSPAVDVKTTRVGGTFDITALHEVPSATDLWAVLAQSPGLRMRGYDVGGSHKFVQTAYETFGLRWQNRIVSDGVDSTEGRGGTGFYFDYYSVEEFQVSASGGDVEATSPGASVVMTVKSGGNELSGLFALEYEGEEMVGGNVDRDLMERGFTGNPNLLFWQVHADLGGPILKDRAWFFGAYNHFYLDKVRSGVPRELATARTPFDNYVAKLSFQLGAKDRLIGYTQWGRKQVFNVGLSALRPPEATADQDSWGWVHKLEWQRQWSGRLFSNLQMKHNGTWVGFLPASDPSNHPSRVDTATGGVSGSRGELDLRRFKPHASGQVNYYLPSGAGSHDFKLGLEWLLDSSQGVNWRSPAVFYRDNSNLGRPRNVDEIELYNYPVLPDNRDAHLDFYLQDIWTVSDRMTLSLGARFTRQHVYYADSILEPTLTEFYPSGTREGKSLLTWFDVAPRLGFAFDLTGEGTTVAKAHYGRYFVNVADSLSRANPNAQAFQRFEFLDPNENGLYDGPFELGQRVFATSEGEGTPVNPEMKPSYTDEISLSIEHELAADTSLRVSWVHKTLENLYGVWNPAQQIPLSEAGIPCGGDSFPCPLGPFTGAPIRIARVPDEAAFQVATIHDTFPGATSRWDTLQLALNRRFRNGFFIQGNFDYQWREELRSALNESRSSIVTDPIDADSPGDVLWQNHSLDVTYQQHSTNWQAKLLARQDLPHQIGVAANVRHQSGFPWAPIHRVPVPGSGTQPIFLENIENNRSDDVTLVDVRVDKTFTLGDRHRITGMLDVYNLLNANPVTNFALRTGGSFGRVIAALEARTLILRVRWQF